MALGRTPRELLEAVDPDEVNELLAFDELEGIGPERLRYTTAIGLLATARAGGSEVELSTLLMDDELFDEDEDQTPEEMIAIAQQYAAIYNAV